MTPRCQKVLSFMSCLVLLAMLFPVQTGAVSQSLKPFGAIMWTHLETLCGFGPRYPGSPGHEKTRAYLTDHAERFADSWREQVFHTRISDGREFTFYNYELSFEGTGEGAPIFLGAHYDTRPFADGETDPARKVQPILGANDGGSGTAVILALAEYLDAHPPVRPVKLLLFDGEDVGKAGSGDYFLGSSYYAESLKGPGDKDWPCCVVVVDMVGKKDLKIFKEVNSTKSAPRLLEVMYQAAADKNVKQFVPMLRYSVRDDHLPFAYRKIPSALIIDFDYPYWHTLEDTLDKCSEDSLMAVFEVLVEMLKQV